jgi:hypothetical protein
MKGYENRVGLCVVGKNTRESVSESSLRSGEDERTRKVLLFLSLSLS